LPGKKPQEGKIKKKEENEHPEGTKPGECTFDLTPLEKRGPRGQRKRNKGKRGKKRRHFKIKLWEKK